jgi:hypothetical protein
MLVTTHQPMIIRLGEKRVKSGFLVRLCREMHLTYLFPRMDEASQLLEDIVVSQQQPPTASHESSPNQPLVDEVVSLIQSSVDPTLPLESEVDTTQVFLVTSYSSGQGGFHPFQWNPLQVLRSFPLIGIVWQSLTFLPTCLSKSWCRFVIRSRYITLLLTRCFC